MFLEILNFAIVIISCLIFFLSSIRIYVIAVHSPLPFLIKGLSLSSFLCFLASIALIPMTLASDSIFSFKTTYFFRFAYTSTQIGLFLFVILLIIPDLKLKLNSLFNVIFATISFTVTIVITDLTVDVVFVNGKNIVKYNFLTIFLSGLTMVIFVVFLLFRDKKINEMEKNSSTTIKKGRAYKIFSVLILIILFTFLLVRLPGINPVIPTYSFLFFMSICYIYISMIFNQVEPFFFVSDIVLKNILIYDKESGNAIYMKSYSESSIDESFSTILASLNSPIKQLIESKAELDQISFQDKTVLISNGKYVLSILIVSRSNIITLLLLESITKMFEKRYFNNSFKENDRIVSSSYSEFEKDIQRIKSYFII